MGNTSILFSRRMLSCRRERPFVLETAWYDTYIRCAYAEHLHCCDSHVCVYMAATLSIGLLPFVMRSPTVLYAISVVLGALALTGAFILYQKAMLSRRFWLYVNHTA